MRHCLYSGCCQGDPFHYYHACFIMCWNHGLKKPRMSKVFILLMVKYRYICLVMILHWYWYKWEIFTTKSSNFERFSKNSWVHINYNNTQVVWIGCKKHCDVIICTNEALDWSKTTFKLLCIEFDTNLQYMWILG